MNDVDRLLHLRCKRVSEECEEKLCKKKNVSILLKMKRLETRLDRFLLFFQLRGKKEK